MESQYDHPTLWGSKRTGPDFARIGGKYSDESHVAYLTEPRAVVPESKMPAYSWLQRNDLKTDDRPTSRLCAGCACPRTRWWKTPHATPSPRPTPDSGMAKGVAERYGADTDIRAFDGDPGRLTEMDALVAYLQIVGQLTDAVHKKRTGKRAVQAEETE